MKNYFFTIVLYFCFGPICAQDNATKDIVKEIHIGTNVASLIRKQGKEKNGQFITTNPYLNVEGVFTLNSKFAIRIPIAYGLNTLDGKIEEGGDLPSHWFEMGPDQYAPSDWYSNGPRLDAYSITSQIMCNMRCSHSPRYYIRPHYLKFQIGLFPKIILHSWKKVSLSLTGGANFGMMDKYALSEYSSFSSIKSGNEIKSWDLTSKRIEYETNPYFFVRGEALLGIDITLTKRFTLVLESGFAQRVSGRGPKPDKIYTNLDNSGYNLILEDADDTEKPYYNSLPFFKRLGKENFINRFSIRYQIK